jgi:hypothetical protein
MSRNITFVLMYHLHKLLDLIYFSYGLAIEWYVKYAAMFAGGDWGGGGGGQVSSPLGFFEKS